MTKEKEYTRTVTDSSMEPYFITMDDSCITVNIKIMPDARYSDSKKEYTKAVGHYSNMASALKAIAKNKTNEKSYTSLEEYMNEYKTITESLNIGI